MLRYNGRDDNLGDQLIMRALADALSVHGKVALLGEPREWMPKVPACRSRLAATAFFVRQSLTGCRVTQVAPPGARLGGTVKRRSLSSLRRTDRIALGFSVPSEADQSWCKNYRWIGVRDNASLAAIRRSGCESAEYFPDLAFLAEESQLEPSERSLVAFSFRDNLPEDEQGGAAQGALLHAIEAVHNALAPERNWSFTTYHQVAEDKAFATDLAGRLAIEEHVDRLTLSSYKHFYNRAAVVVSNRLHCLLLGALLGALPVALTSRSHTKIVSLYETLGWGNLLLRIEDGPQVLSTQLNGLLHRHGTLLQEIAACCARQRELGNGLLATRAACRTGHGDA